MSPEVLVADPGGRLQKSVCVIELFGQDNKTLQLRFVTHSERRAKLIYRISFSRRESEDCDLCCLLPVYKVVYTPYLMPVNVSVSEILF